MKVSSLAQSALGWLRRLRLRLTRRPEPAASYGMKVGKSCTVGQPRELSGAENIHIGDRTLIRVGAWLAAYPSYAGRTFQAELRIGSDVYIGGFATITAIQRVTIGDGCVLSEFVYVSDHSHGFNPTRGLIAEQPLVSKGEVSIGAHSFVGYQACILPGVVLGSHCVVGANSVVTRSFPDYSMVAGTPANLVATFSLTEGRWLRVPKHRVD